MKTTVLVFHPNIKESRVNRHLAEQAQKQQGVNVRYLYDLYPHCAVDVAVEQQELLGADRIVLQFPMYWYSTPALVRQWVDEVMTWGWAYGTEGDKLHGKEFLLALSCGAPAERYSREGAYRYSVCELLRPLQATSNMIGTRYLRPFIVSGALSISDADLQAAALEYGRVLTSERELLGDHE